MFKGKDRYQFQPWYTKVWRRRFWVRAWLSAAWSYLFHRDRIREEWGYCVGVTPDGAEQTLWGCHWDAMKGHACVEMGWIHTLEEVSNRLGIHGGADDE